MENWSVTKKKKALMSRNYKSVHSDYNSPKSLTAKGALGRGRQSAVPDRASLSRFRVIQRELVYVIGIPIDIATEEVLGKHEYFGQYGAIKKIAVNNSTVHSSSSTYQRPTVSAYVTFENIDDAWECLYAFESFSIDGHMLKASFGTSKYCSAFLSGQKCTKSDCMYMHYTGDPADSFSTEEIQQNSQRFLNMTRPLRPDDYFDFKFQDSPPTKFPPRRIFTAANKPSNNSASPNTNAQQQPPQQSQQQSQQQQQLPQQSQPQSQQQQQQQEASSIEAASQVSGNGNVGSQGAGKEGNGTEKAEKPLENEFVKSLMAKSNFYVVKPLKVNYQLNQSLEEQFCLGRTSIRTIFEKSLQAKE